MTKIVIHRSKASMIWNALFPFLIIVALLFFINIVAGLIAATVMAISAVCFRRSIRELAAAPPIILVLDDSGIDIRHGWIREIVIPWKDIVSTGLRHGGKRGTLLGIELREPEIYLGRFMRINLALSRFHISIPVEELDRNPKEIRSLIEDMRLVHA
jgi:hypothetical protein